MSHQTKTSRIDAGGIAGREEDASRNKDPSESVTEVESELGFDSLPDEMLVKVFSCLGHGDKLCARLVNKRWCKLMTSSLEFKNSVVYNMKPQTKAMDTLSKSVSSWKTVRFQNFRVDGKSLNDFRVLDGIAADVVALEFCACIIVGKAFKPIITMFSNLEVVNIRYCKYKTEARKPKSVQEALVIQDQQVSENNWATSVQKLRVLDIRLEDSAAENIMSEFKGLSNLVSFNGASWNFLNENTTAVVESLCQILFASQTTLKNLSIDVNEEGSMDGLYMKALQRICTGGDDRTRTMDLINCHLDHDYELNLHNLEILQSFLRTQNNLVHVTLPSVLEGLLKEQQALLLNLPRTLRSLKTRDTKYLFKNFLDVFPALCRLKVYGELHPSVLSGKKYLNMRQLKCELLSNRIPGWVTSFPNLTKLTLDNNEENQHQFTDQTLQAIIKNMKKLRSLKLIIEFNISDFGVTGIRREYCRYLFETRRLLKFNYEEVPAKYKTGVPLSSLTGLKELIIWPRTEITDVGIFFGFGFNALRTLKVLGTCRGVTDWGLDYLGKLNPDLEVLEIDFNASKFVSPAGISHLCNRLRRIRDPRKKIKIVNTKFNSFIEEETSTKTD